MVASDVVALGVFVKVDVGGGERARGRGHAEVMLMISIGCVLRQGGMWDQL